MPIRVSIAENILRNESGRDFRLTIMSKNNRK